MCKHALKKALLEFELKILERNTINLNNCAWKWDFSLEEREFLNEQHDQINQKKKVIINKLRHLD